MADENPTTDIDTQGTATGQTRRARREATTGQNAVVPKSATTKVAKKSRPPRAARVARTRPARPKGSAARPLRSLAILTMVGGLIATVALPAYAATRSVDAEAQTLQQIAVDDAQSLVVASDATSTELTRQSYSATTQEEIDEKKAKEAAEAAAAAAAERARSYGASPASVPANVQMVSPGTGEVRWPLLTFTKGRGLWDSGYHQGVDLLAAGGTPIYAAAAGVVRVSQESFGGYGVAITIDHVIAGQRVSTLYGHMIYGSRQVSSGQSVAAGQLIGLVGSTGSSTANHLHFEVHINDSVVDPWAWLVANAG